MEADRMTNEEDVIDVPVGVQQLFDQRHHLNINRNVRKAQPKLFRAAVICAAILLMIVYFVMPVSRVSGITLSGNAFLSRDYILDLADLSNNSIYYLSLPFILERRIEKDPLIEKAKVSLERDNSVKITVTERKILGYRYEDEPLILMADGSYVELKSTYLDIITKIPLILGFNTEEQTEKLCRSFADVDEKIIRDISEISQYSLSYDPEAIRVLMRSGGYFMGNFYNMGVLNRYWAIYNYQKDKSQCIFADDSMTSAYSKMCPWDEPVVNREYWTDDTGKVITNTYGDKVEKHYYTDADGNWAVDEKGNRIPIPINLQGYEVPDSDFLENYEKGYYKTGKLVIEEEKKDEEKKDGEEKKEGEETADPEQTPAEGETAAPEEQGEETPAEEPAENPEENTDSEQSEDTGE